VDAEIMEVGSRAGNTLSSVLRGCEGTTGAAHDAGRPIENRFTKGTYDELAAGVEFTGLLNRYVMAY
jgi:hypothetical protein